MRISFDRAAEFFDKTRGPPKHIMEKLVKTLVNELRDYGTILDAGVGTGRFAKPLQDNGFEVFGIDIAKKMMSKAVEKRVNNLFRADACFIPFKNESFDVTVCIGLLHLISKWQVALSEICRVTKEIMVSTFHSRKDPVREAYNRLIQDCGYSTRRPGKGTHTLKDLVKPAKSVFVGSYQTTTDERLDYLSKRASSSQWEIPEDVNKRVVDELRGKFAGKALSQELHVLAWNKGDLQAYCSTHS